MSLPLSLRSSGEQIASQHEPDEQSISFLLHRIGRQRGSFRNFTEESLLAELAESSATESIPATSEAKEIVEHESASQAEVLEEAPIKIEEESANGDTETRDRILQLIAIALNESALALDFTSLLLSSSRQAAADSMSPALKAAVPAGSLSNTRVRRLPIPKAEIPTETILGFKAEGLSHAAKMLSQASTDAEEDYTTDSIFWEEVQALIKAGWHVFKPRQDSAGVAVRYGPAPRQYILLEKDKNGHVDVSKFDNKKVLLQLSLRQDGKTVLTRVEHDVVDSAEKVDQPKILPHLERARKSLLNSNIFDDLVKEARECANQGLTIVDRLISIPIGQDSHACLELIDSDDSLVDGLPQNDQNTDIPDASSSDRDDGDLLCSLAAVVFSRYSSKPKKHPLKTFISCLYHGRRTMALQHTCNDLIDGLARLDWSVKPSLISNIEPSTSGWHEPVIANYCITFHDKILNIKVTTTLSSITTYTIESASAIAQILLARTTRQLSCTSGGQIIDMLRFELMEAIQEDLCKTPGTVKSAHGVVNIDGTAVTMALTPSGEIVLKKEHMRKIVQSNLALEILDEENYTS